MLRYSFLFLFIIFSIGLFAQVWEPIGADDNNVGSPRTVTEKMKMKLDHSGVPYVAYLDNYSHAVSVKKFINDKWEFVGLESFSGFGSADIGFAFNSLNIPHVVYAGRNIEVRKFNGYTWELAGPTIPLPTQTYLNDISFSFDRNDNSFVMVSVTTFFTNVQNIYLWKLEGTNWKKLESGSTPLNGRYIDIAIDSSSVPYIVYGDDAYEGKATIRKFNGTGWQVVGSPGISELRTSVPDILIDTDNLPIVCYVTFAGIGYVEKFNGAAWTKLGGGSVSNAVGFASLATDKQNGLYVLLLGGMPELKKYNGSSWVTLIARVETEYTYQPCYGAFDVNGTCFIGYRNEYQQAAVSKFQSGKWQSLGQRGLEYYNNRPAIDSFNTIYIGGHLYDLDAVGVRKFVNNQWQQVGQLLNESRYVHPSTCHFTLSPGGTPYIIFKDERQPSPSLYKYVNNGWVQIPVSSEIVINENTGFIVGKDETPYLVLNEDPLKVMKYNGQSWQQLGNYLPDGLIQKQVKFAFDKQGRLYVGYVGYIPNTFYTYKLFIRRFNGSSWDELGSFDYTHVNFDFALSKTHVPYVLHSEAVTRRPLVSSLSGTGWVRVGGTVHTSEVAQAKLGFGAGNIPYVIFKSRESDRLMAKRFEDSLWTTIGPSDAVSGVPIRETSLLFDNTGLPVAVFSTNYDGMFAKKLILDGPIQQYRFVGNGNWSDPANWLSNKTPPNYLPAGCEIIIDPPSGVCILNIPVTIAPGAKLTVKSGKTFVITGSLN